MAENITGANNKNSGGHTPPEMSSGNNKMRGFFSYALLPGIIPEIKNLASNNFGYLAYLIAIIYQTVRILPQNHPYTKPENIGKFGIRKVIAAAANQVTFSKDNIDQIFIFIAILAGLVLLVLQFVFFIFFLFTGNAWAGGGGIPDGIFDTPNPDKDIAFYMIREVFGLPTMFGTLGAGADGGTGDGPTGEAAMTGMHQGLQLLFKFYNFAILFVAVIVFLYYVIVVIGETANTGVPFGQRFSHVYAPFRLVIAIGLLVPLNYGFNGAQYIAFYAAKLGSGLASQGWVRFNENTLNPLGSSTANLIAQPNAPDLTGLVEGMATIRACMAAYETQEDIIIEPYFVLQNPAQIVFMDRGTSNYEDVVENARENGIKGHISLYFGAETSEATEYAGNMKPYCGEVKLPIQLTDQTQYDAEGFSSPEQIQRYYFLIVNILFYMEELKVLAERIAWGVSADPERKPCDAVFRTGLQVEINGERTAVDLGNCEASYLPPSEFKQSVIDRITLINTFFQNIVFNNVRQNVRFEISDDIIDTGWGGAGIWYNSIAEINGVFTSSVINPPNVEKRPIVTQALLDDKSKTDGAFDDCTMFKPNISQNQAIEAKKGFKDDYYNRVVNQSHSYWRCDRSGGAANFFWDTIVAVFGLNGLFSIRDTYDIDGAGGETIRLTINPLAKLSTVGKGLIDSSVQNLGLAMASSFGGGALGVLSQHLGAAAQAASSMFVSIATIGLSIGFLLYYVLPFLPFVYFFFAVGGWVKGLFEAMVGTPLWALAHLRIDGDGLPGKSAMNGYLLVFEIFLRPILTVFGLIGGMAIFTALATILNEVFDLAVFNVTGTDLSEGRLGFSDSTGGEGGNDASFGRHVIDEFFFTVVYAIILYMMAVSSFKMITLVPNNILRWLGQSVSSFNDQAQDPAQGLTQYAALGGARIGGQISQGITQLGDGAGKLVGTAGSAAAGNTRPNT